MDPDLYCQQKAAASGSSFYYSFRFLDAARRTAILALYAFCREVDDVVDDVHDAGVARLKLDWWRKEIDRVFAATGEAPQHPVGKALRRQLPRYELAQEYFLEIIDGMEMDLDCSRYADFSELALYCYRAAGVVGLLSAEIFGYRDRATLDYATALGTALQLTNIIRDVREDADRGRIYLPQDELARFGLSSEDLFSHRGGDALVELLAFQAARAREYYDKAYGLLPAADRHTQRSGVIMGAIYQATLEEIERDGFRVMEQRISLPPLRKLWIAWRTARHLKKGRPLPISSVHNEA